MAHPKINTLIIIVREKHNVLELVKDLTPRTADARRIDIESKCKKCKK